MKLILKTTVHALIYQRDDKPPCTMYGLAANCGVQFDDACNTKVRALATIDPGVHCLSINQDGVEHRDFYVPVGTQITLNGTTVTPSCYQLTLYSRSVRVYQHHFRFKTAKQARLAARRLSRINITIQSVACSRRCRLLTFQTTYALGPIMCMVLSHEMQSVSALFNRQPRTWKPFPLWQRVTFGQVLLTLLTFLVLCGNSLTDLFYFNSLTLWNNVVMGLFFTICVAYVSNDILGLVQHYRCLRGSGIQTREVQG